MATIQTFEDFEIWKLARAFNKRIYAVTRRKAFDQDFDLRRQIRRSSVSCMSNAAEGFERSNNNYFIQFLAIAKGSIGEARSQLYSCLDGAYIDQEEFISLRDEATLIGRKIGKLMTYLEDHRETKSAKVGASTTTRNP